MALSLQFVQRKSLEARDRENEADSAERAGDPFEPGELAFKLAYLRDSGLEQRRAWLERLHCELDAGFRYCEFDSFIFSAQWGEFDVALVHGLDWRRLVGVLSANRALLRNRITIAVMNESSPTRRAALLMAGYDDVFDLRMAIPEARARIRRHIMRLSVSRNQGVLDTLGVSAWPKGVSPALLPAIERAASRFTPRERLLFGCLFGGFGRVVLYSTLLRAYELRELKNGVKSLRVAMSGLRRKLDGLFEIMAHPHQGYELQLVEGRAWEHLLAPCVGFEDLPEADPGETGPRVRSVKRSARKLAS